MNEQEFAELAAGYALNALSPDDTKAFESTRRQHPEWEHHVRTDAATAALLADGVTDVAPPPALRTSLLAQIAAAPIAAVVSEPTPALRADRRAAAPEVEPALAGESVPAGETAKPRRWGARGWFALAASMALLVGVGWGAVFVSEQLNTPASVVALDQIESASDAQSETVTLADGGEVTAHWSESVGKAVLVSDGLPTISDDESFELWFVRDGAPISAGTFTSEGGTATALLEGAVESGDVIAITVEQAGGSTTGQPTTEPIVVIETA